MVRFPKVKLPSFVKTMKRKSRVTEELTFRFLELEEPDTSASMNHHHLLKAEPDWCTFIVLQERMQQTHSMESIMCQNVPLQWASRQSVEQKESSSWHGVRTRPTLWRRVLKDLKQLIFLLLSYMITLIQCFTWIRVQEMIFLDSKSHGLSKETSKTQSSLTLSIGSAEWSSGFVNKSKNLSLG